MAAKAVLNHASIVTTDIYVDGEAVRRLERDTLIVEEVSQRLANEQIESLRRAQEEAYREQLGAALGTLAAEIAHEIRFPINFFRMLVERQTLALQAGRTLTAADLDEDLDIGKEEVARLERMADHLRRIAQSRLLDRRDCPLRPLMDHVRLLLRDQLAGRLLEVDVSSSLVVEADRALRSEPRVRMQYPGGSLALTPESTSSDFTRTSYGVDLGDELNPIEGYTYASLPAAAQEALISSFAADPSVTELVAAVGTTTVSDGTDTALLIFLGLNRELDATETQQFVDGVTAGGTNLEQGEVAGQTGWAYVSADGTQGFITIRQDTVVIGQSDSVDHLSAVIQGLFVANPDL